MHQLVHDAIDLTGSDDNDDDKQNARPQRDPKKTEMLDEMDSQHQVAYITAQSQLKEDNATTLNHEDSIM